jgi:3-oxoacyl-[acyl-carrier protein] reductase
MILNSPHNDRFKKIKERVYLNRFAKPIEIAKTIFWLATESPEYINGETIDINNGAQSI